jgi:glycosyltransferase involved in cell wall biosynthesis
MEVSTLALLNELRSAGIPLARVNTSDPGDSLANRGSWTARNARVALHHIASVARQVARGDVAAVYVPISQERPAFYRDALFLIVARAARKQTIVHLHGGAFADFYRDERPWMRALIRATVGRSALGIVLSDRLRPALECVLPASRVTVVLIGVDVPSNAARAPRERDDAVLALFFSTLLPEKGLFVFLEAVAEARASRPQLQAEVAGNWFGAETEALARRRVAELGIADAVTFTGTVSGEAKAAMFQRADVFCFPSFYALEGTPSVVIEAMAASLPVLATAWRGIPDLVGETGVLVDEPEPSVIAKELICLVDDPERRQELGAAAARRYREQFTQAAFGRRIVAALAPHVGVRADGSDTR